MTKTPRLNDLQLILLSSAAARENGSLMPLPEKFANDTARVDGAIKALVKRQLVEEQPVTDRSLSFREHDQELIGIFISDAGRAAIGVDDEGAGSEANAPGNVSEAPTGRRPRAGSKTELVLGLLKREEGATIAELTSATGWLPHTTRAHLTGLKKKGHTIEKSKRDDVTCYRIGEAG